uniref:Protein BFR2 n=1 Tax=Blastobotrys adeninivorans TaxID=409370 RepID=A0A060TI04_BLAAD
MVSLADQLAALADPKPVDFDPEDAERTNIDADSGSDIEKDDRATEHYIPVEKSRLRDNSIQVDGTKYKGARVSRKDLYDESESSDEEELDGFEDGELEEGESETGDEEEEESELEEGDEEESESEDNENEEDNANEDTKRRELKQLIKEEQKKIVSHLSSTAQADAKKGEAVQHQMNVYEACLEARINLQKAVAASNSLPLTYEPSVMSADSNELQAGALKSMYGLLDRISDLRVKLMINDNVISEHNSTKKRTLDDYLKDSQSLDAKLGSYRTAILDKWSRKVQSSTGAAALQSNKFRSLNQTAAVQVNSVLADMDRLVKRTRMNRSGYKPLGQDTNDHDQQNGKVDTQELEYVFDDTDFYRLQLKDLVDRRMADSASAADGIKWTVAKPKIKKNVDTKASKGRKLRYHVQEKIQGFDAPRPQVFLWDDEQTDELFSSLFGQTVKVDEESDHSESESEEEVAVNPGGLKIFG